MVSGFGVSDLRVSGFGLRAEGFRVSGFRVSSFGLRAKGLVITSGLSVFGVLCRGTSLIRNKPLLRLYSRTMPRAL